MREDHRDRAPGLLVNDHQQAAQLRPAIATILDINGRAAVVLPDNVLFEGAPVRHRRRLLASTTCTMLRLPTGIFYAQGVKANVLFFDRKPAAEQPWTKRLWVYDLRTNSTSPSSRTRCAAPTSTTSSPGAPDWARAERAESERWKAFSVRELVARDKANLDITWLRTTPSRTWTTCPPRM